MLEFGLDFASHFIKTNKKKIKPKVNNNLRIKVIEHAVVEIKFLGISAVLKHQDACRFLFHSTRKPQSPNYWNKKHINCNNKILGLISGNIISR